MVSTALTFLFGWGLSLISSNSYAIAYAGTVGATIGFYGFILIRDYIRNRRTVHPAGLREKIHLLLRCIRNMGFEFGLAEVLDFLLIRPFFLLYGPKLLHNYFWGVLVGKILADILFFALSILMFEIKKKHLRWF